MPAVKLRPYQQALDHETDDAFASGLADVGVNSPTGSGKTVFFSHKIKEFNGGSVAIAHRQELVSQISVALARNDVRHRIIGQKQLVSNINSLHMAELGRSYYDANGRCAAAGVDTLIRLKPHERAWCAQIGLVVMDEAHHCLRENKWGKGRVMFPQARGLHVSATWLRADGQGLGRHADGFVDTLVNAPTMRQLIDAGYLTDYKVVSVNTKDLDLTGVTISSATGDLNANQLREAVHKSSTLVGDVVREYLQHAKGKLGVTFAVDVEEANKIARKFNEMGVRAEVVSAGTPDHLRLDILRRFRRREILQLVNVDLFGEGFDLPAIEVVSMARPTESWSLYCLDPETEVLTPEGWVRHDQIEKSKQVIGFDLQTGETKPVDIQSRIRRPLYENEKMYRVDGPHLDLAISDRHDLVVKGRSSGSKNWVKETAETAAKRKSMFKIPVAGRGYHAGSGLTSAELRLLGWFLSDGGLNKKTNALTIYQASNKLAHLDSIRAAIVGCGFKFGEHTVVRKNCPKTHANVTLFTISKGAPRGRGKHLTGWARLEKWLNKSIPECYDSLTREELAVLLETLNLGDGNNEDQSLDYKRGTLIIACGTNSVMADRLQALCVTRGFRCNLATPHYEGRSKWHYLNIRDADTASLPGVNDLDGSVRGKKPYKRTRLTESEYRPEFVWCVSNELGTLLTRRNGKVAIVGNCQQWGRVLRLMLDPALYPMWDTYTDAERLAFIAASEKPFGLILDHVGNIYRHMGPPDARTTFSLDRREKRSTGPSDAIPLRPCINPKCAWPYMRVLVKCPKCGTPAPLPALRTGPEMVDGNLILLTPEALAIFGAERARIDQAPEVHGHDIVAMSIRKTHAARAEAQQLLRSTMSWWSGLQDALGRPDNQEKQSRFYFAFGIDTANAQMLGATEAFALRGKICEQLSRYGIDGLVNMS